MLKQFSESITNKNRLSEIRNRCVIIFFFSLKIKRTRKSPLYLCLNVFLSLTFFDYPFIRLLKWTAYVLLQDNQMELCSNRSQIKTKMHFMRNFFYIFTLFSILTINITVGNVKILMMPIKETKEMALCKSRNKNRCHQICTQLSKYCMQKCWAYTFVCKCMTHFKNNSKSH